MRIVRVKNLFRSPGLNQLLCNLPQQGMVNTRRQFPVRESTGTAFSELYIRTTVKLAVFPKAAYRFTAPIYIISSLQDKRAITVLRQRQGRSQSCRPGADYNRSVSQSFRPVNNQIRLHFFYFSNRFIKFKLPQHGLFIFYTYLQSKDEKYTRFASGINRATHNRYFLYIRRRTPQFTSCNVHRLFTHRQSHAYIVQS